jgi:hypothetical protein
MLHPIKNPDLNYDLYEFLMLICNNYKLPFHGKKLPFIW